MFDQTKSNVRYCDMTVGFWVILVTLIKVIVNISFFISHSEKMYNFKLFHSITL